MPIKNNIDLFNAVRQELSGQFQTRIPALAIDNIREVCTAISCTEFTPLRNEFMSCLFNRLGMEIFNKNILKNPYSALIRYKDMEYADAIAEHSVQPAIPEMTQFGKCGEAVDPFIKVCPDLKTEYHHKNKSLTYPVTVDDQRLKRAFLSPDGFYKMVEHFMNSLLNGAEMTDYYLTKQILSDYCGDVKNASLPLLPTQTLTMAAVTNEVTSAAFVKALKTAVLQVSLPNQVFNPQKIWNTKVKSELSLFIRADVLPVIDVDLLRSSFQDSAVNLNIKTYVFDTLPVATNGVNNDKVFAMLFADDFPVFVNEYNKMTEAYNPRGLYTTYYLHRSTSFGVSYSQNCIIFRET